MAGIDGSIAICGKVVRLVRMANLDMLCDQLTEGQIREVHYGPSVYILTIIIYMQYLVHNVQTCRITLQVY